MDKILTYTITSQEAGMQVLEFLRSRGFSRHILKNMPAACSGKERKQTLPYILFHYTQFFFENQDKNLNSY